MSANSEPLLVVMPSLCSAHYAELLRGFWSGFQVGKLVLIRSSVGTFVVYGLVSSLGNYLVRASLVGGSFLL